MERVVGVDPGVTWEPNAPEAVMVSSDGRVELSLGAHPDDPDQRRVTILFFGAQLASQGVPNDEARSTHRLYQAGLAEVLWAGVVQDSELVNQVLRSVALTLPLTHWIFPLKESTVEVVARDYEIVRREPGAVTLTVPIEASRWETGRAAEVGSEVSTVRGFQDVTEILEAMVHDLASHPGEWENHTLTRYLEALAAIIGSADALSANRGQPGTPEPSWQLFAELLVAASGYE